MQKEKSLHQSVYSIHSTVELGPEHKNDILYDFDAFGRQDALQSKEFCLPNKQEIIASNR